jgi:hypothetical protein
MTSLLDATELAQFEVSSAPRSAQYLQEVLTAGKRAKNLVQQILTFSRKSGQQRQPIYLHVLISDA